MPVPFQTEYRRDFADTCDQEKVAIAMAHENLYDLGLPFPTCELDRVDYLRSISYFERHALVDLFCGVLGNRYISYASFSLFAVGTTTYPHSYWESVRSLMEKYDPDKLPIVERRGEDIDLILTTWRHDKKEILKPRPGNDEDWITQITEYLREAGVPYQVIEDKNANGTGYFAVPPAYIEQEGEGLIRYKSYKYGGEALIVSYPGCRPFHIRFDTFFTTHEKLRHERCNGFPFSILFGPEEIALALGNAVKKADQQRDLFDGGEPYPELPFKSNIKVEADLPRSDEKDDIPF